MMEFDATVGQASDDRIVGDHDDGAALGMELAQQPEDDLFVLGVQIAGGLVGQDDLRIVDEGAGNADALLLAAGKLRGQVMRRGLQADAARARPGLRFRPSCCGSTAPA